MNIRILFPRLLLLSALSFVFISSAAAQSSAPDSHSVAPAAKTNGAIQLETEPVAPSPEERRPRSVGSEASSKASALTPAINLTSRLDQLLLAAMQSHIGASYHFNRTGPESFDCSGFVWRAFNDAGVNFQRGPARSYWATMSAPPKDEQFKFGTLVFFGGLTHVGIVVDEKGFYHSARHGGVMYSPFNEYWLSRIDGFRRVPVDSLQTPAAKAKPSMKPAAAATTVEQDNEP